MLQTCFKWLNLSRLRGEEQGQGIVEYALIIVLVAFAVLIGATALGVNLNAAFQALADWVQANIVIPA